jgi:enterobacterial common antigen flippase
VTSHESSFGAQIVPPAGRSRLQGIGSRLLRAERPIFAMFQSVGTQVFILAINFLTGVITARLLGPQGRGVYTAIAVWPTLFGALAAAGSNSAIVVRLRKAPEAAGAIASASLVLAAASCALAIGLGASVLPALMTQYTPAVIRFAQLCLVSVLVNGLQQVLRQTFAGVGQYSSCNLTQLLPQLFHLIALASLIPFAAVTSHSAILALLISGAAAVVVLLPRFFRSVKPHLAGTRSELRNLSSYSLRAAPMDIVFALSANADRLVLIPLLPASQLGFYAVAFSFSRVIQLVQPAIASVFLAQMSAQNETGGRQLHDHACRFLLAALLGGAALLWICGERLLVLAYGAEFAAANTIFRLLVAEASLAVLSQVTIQLFLSRDRPGVASTIQVIALGLSLILLLELVPRYGTEGAAAALLITGAVRWVLLLGAVKVILKQRLPRLYLTLGDFHYVRGRLR